MSKINPKVALEPISWLIGKWCSEKAYVEFPGIDRQNYDDEMEFKCFGQPLLAYSSKTWLQKTTPKHYETGYLKIKPGTNELSMMLAHNFGLTSVEEGHVDGCTINLKSVEISRNSFAREPAVCKLERQYQLCGDKLEFILYMETSKTPLKKHLRVTYIKAE